MNFEQGPPTLSPGITVGVERIHVEIQQGTGGVNLRWYCTGSHIHVENFLPYYGSSVVLMWLSVIFRYYVRHNILLHFRHVRKKLNTKPLCGSPRGPLYLACMQCFMAQTYHLQLSCLAWTKLLYGHIKLLKSQLVHQFGHLHRMNELSLMSCICSLQML